MKIVERNRYNDEGQVFQKRVLTFEPYSFDQIESVIKKIQENLSGDLLKGKRLKYTNIMAIVIILRKHYFL